MFGIATNLFSQIKFESKNEKQSASNLLATNFKEYRLFNLSDCLNKDKSQKTLQQLDLKKNIVNSDSNLKESDNSNQNGNRYRMPCIKPEENGSLLILKPDSTVSYSLRIKTIE
jgi:hypothetical protein